MHTELFSVIFFLQLRIGLTQRLSMLDPCLTAPDEPAKHVCRQLDNWDRTVRHFESTRSNTTRQHLAAFPRPSTVEHCMSIPCICSFQAGRMSGGVCILPNGRRLGKALRKEYRLLTDDERNRFHELFFRLARANQWNAYSAFHHEIEHAPGAHAGPAFMGWHREYIKRLEIMMRVMEPDLALPYWDSTLDGAIPSASQSCLFSDDLQGNTDSSGNVVTGPFRNWRGNQGLPIQRSVGRRDRMFSEDDINQLMSETRIDRVLAYSMPRDGCPFTADFTNWEYRHGRPHNFIGGCGFLARNLGDMLLQRTSTNDPLFFLHHSFVDMQWEQWRQRRQSRAQRETQYSMNIPTCSSSAHFSTAPMGPFQPMINMDGLSNMYTDNLYEYQARPTCNLGENCGSSFLFCDRSHGQPRCASKIMRGGNCRGYWRGEDACYQSRCLNGVCGTIALATSVCSDSHPSCAMWARFGECHRNPRYMQYNCRRSCRLCRWRVAAQPFRRLPLHKPMQLKHHRSGGLSKRKPSNSTKHQISMQFRRRHVGHF